MRNRFHDYFSHGQTLALALMLGLSGIASQADDTPVFGLRASDVGLCRLGFSTNHGDHKPKYLPKGTARDFAAKAVETEKAEAKAASEANKVATVQTANSQAEAVANDVAAQVAAKIDARVRLSSKRSGVIRKLIRDRNESRKLQENSGLDVDYYRLSNLHKAAEVKSALLKGEVATAASLLNDWFNVRHSVYEVMEATQNLEDLEVGIKQVESKLSQEGITRWRRTLERIRHKEFKDRPVDETQFANLPGLAKLFKLEAMRSIQEDSIVTNLELIARHMAFFLDGSELLINTAQSDSVLGAGIQGFDLLRGGQYKGTVTDEAGQVLPVENLAARAVEVLKNLDEYKDAQYVPGNIPPENKINYLRERIKARFLQPALDRDPTSNHIQQQIKWLDALQSIPELQIVEAIYLRDTVVKMFNGSLLLYDLQRKVARSMDKKYENELMNFTPIIYNMTDPWVTALSTRFPVLKWAGDLWRQATARATMHRHMTRLAAVLLSKGTEPQERLKQLEDAASEGYGIEVYMTFYRMPAFRDVWDNLKQLFIEADGNGGARVKPGFERFEILKNRMLYVEKLIHDDLTSSENKKTVLQYPDLSPFNPTAPATRTGTWRSGIKITGLATMIWLYSWVGVDIQNAYIMDVVPKHGPVLVEKTPEFAKTAMRVLQDRLVESAKKSADYREAVRKGQIKDEPGVFGKMWNWTFGSETVSPPTSPSGGATYGSPYGSSYGSPSTSTYGTPSSSGGTYSSSPSSSGGTYTPPPSVGPGFPGGFSTTSPSVPRTTSGTSGQPTVSSPGTAPRNETTVTAPSAATPVRASNEIPTFDPKKLPTVGELKEIIKNMTPEERMATMAAWRAAKEASAP